MGHPELVLAALISEAILGYPAFIFRLIGHPVTWIGAAISALERVWNSGSPSRRRFLGFVSLATISSIVAVIGWIIEQGTSYGFGIILCVLFATTGLAQRSLDDHVRAVLVPLKSKQIDVARNALSHIVGRDTGNLTESEISLGAIETLAESFCDGIIAPVFWFIIAGLPGLFVCKAINTADSMIGHKDSRYLHFGWAAARTDDLINFIPARISGLLICISGIGGFKTMMRDASHHVSPNGGWPEAAMAGALKRGLGGPVSYDGEIAQRVWLGDGPLPDAQDLARALWVYRRACLFLWASVGVIAWLA